MTSWGCCVLLYDPSGEPLVRRHKPGNSRRDVSGSEFFTLLHRLQLWMFGRTNACQRAFSWLFLRVGFSFFYIPNFNLGQWLIFPLCAGGAEFAPRVSESEEVSTGVETGGQLRGRRIVVTESLVPLAGAPAWCLWGCLQSESQSGVVGADVWWR